jgi:hypothetical protein
MTAPSAQPSSSRRFWLRRVLVIAGAIALGLALQLALGAHLASIEDLSRRDVVAARAKLAIVLEVVSIGVFGPVAGLGVLLALASRRALAQGRFPPPGRWGFGSARVFEGERARRVARLLLATAVVLVVCSLAAGALTFSMAAALLACRAT